jgi:hypothetical protein
MGELATLGFYLQACPVVSTLNFDLAAWGVDYSVETRVDRGVDLHHVTKVNSGVRKNCHDQLRVRMKKCQFPQAATLGG